jgi:hypothetical protein
LEFDYRVMRAPAKLTVQFAPEWNSSGWTDVRSWVVSNAMSQFSHELAYLGTNINGYLRVINDRSGEQYTNAIVLINNAVLWDEPDVNETSWRAYNVKISNTDPQRVMLDESKGCSLNNSQTAETDPVQTLYDTAFIKSPLLPTGIGSVSFMARSYVPYQVSPLKLYATTSSAGPLAPDSAWSELASFDVSNRFYETYTYTPVDGRDYRAFKLMTYTGVGFQRVCLEELAAAEPVFPGFEISAVHSMCIDNNAYNDERRQPLHSDEVGIQAQVSNIRQDPRNIQMFVSYYVGTNVWGADNWPAGEVKTLPMVLTDPGSLTYRTDINNALGSIPVQEKNTVIQYRVWATYEDETGLVLTTKQKSFENPSWYYPTDLNQRFASQGWSPYYIVYDAPVGAIWINEINVVDQDLTGNNPYAGENKYIEIAVPADFDFSGWRVDLVGESRSSVTIVIPSGLPPQEAVTNGYAFFVIGQTRTPSQVLPPPLPKLDLEYPGQYWGVLSTSRPSGVRLKRPLGMYEHAVAWDVYPEISGLYDGQIWVAGDPEKKFEYVGKEGHGGSLNVLTNSVRYAVPRPADWAFLSQGWTPGGPNLGQTVPDANLMAPGVSNVVIQSMISQIHGSQNGKRSMSLSFKLRKDSDTNILYVADSWYRLTSVKVDGIEKLSGEVPVYDLALPNVQSNVNVVATIGMRSDIGASNLDGNILAWLMSFPDAPFAPTWYGRNPYDPASDRRELTLTERYWVDANPTTTNYLRGGVVGAVRDPATTNYFVTVALDLNGTNLTHLMGVDATNHREGVFKIEVRQPPAVSQWTTHSQFRFNAQSFDASHRSTAFVFNPFRYLIPEADPDKPLAFRWVLEYEYDILGKPTLVPTNAPPVIP